MSRSRELADFLVASGNKLELKGDAGEDACIKKNDATGRDEMQIYSGSDAYSTGSKGAGIHLYGNSDSQHDGDMAFLTGPNDNGNARIIISGHEDKARVTIGNSTSSRSIWDFVDLNEDPAVLNLKDASSQPALYIKGASASEGDITCPPADAMQFGHWEIDTSSADYGFTERFRMDTSGNLKIKDGNLIMGTAGNGIDFSDTGNGNGTMSSELLDDYEEGTWSPTSTHGSVSGSNCWYVKIGRLVTINGYFSSFSDTSSGNAIGIGGLPYPSTASNHSAVGSMIGAGINDDYFPYLSSGSSSMFFYNMNSGSSYGALTHSALSSSGSYYITLTYQSAS